MEALMSYVKARGADYDVLGKITPQPRAVPLRTLFEPLQKAGPLKTLKKGGTFEPPSNRHTGLGRRGADFRRSSRRHEGIIEPIGTRGLDALSDQRL
jgi:hypothetical protein